MPERQFDLASSRRTRRYVAAIRASQLDSPRQSSSRTGSEESAELGLHPDQGAVENAEVYTHFKTRGVGISCKDLKFDFRRSSREAGTVATGIPKGSNTFLEEQDRAYQGRGPSPETGKLEFPETGKEWNRFQPNRLSSRRAPGPGRSECEDRRQTGYIIYGSDGPSKIPKSMVIIGAGAIGVEFAYFYNAFGTHVTLLEMLPNILPEEQGISKLLESSLRKTGHRGLHAGEDRERDDFQRSHRAGHYSGGRSNSPARSADAVGVQGNVENMGSKRSACVLRRLDPGGRFSRTSVKDVYAIGDVAGPPWLAHVASKKASSVSSRLPGRTPADRLR